MVPITTDGRAGVILKAKKMAQMNLVSTKVLDIKASFECVIFLTCVRLIQELKKTRFTSL